VPPTIFYKRTGKSHNSAIRFAAYKEHGDGQNSKVRFHLDGE